MDLEQYVEMFRVLPMACMIMDPTFTVVEITDKYTSLTGRTREEVIGNDFFGIIDRRPIDTSEDKDVVVDQLRKSFEKVRESKISDNLPLVRYDFPDERGILHARYWATWTVPLMNENGELLFILHRAEDVTRFYDVIQTIYKMGDNLHNLSGLIQDMLNGTFDQGQAK